MKHNRTKIVAVRMSAAFALILGASNPSRIAAQEGEIAGNTQPLTAAQNDSSNPRNDAVVLVGGGCTGTLIAPRLVATAGHCVRHDPPVPNLAATNDGGSDWELPGVWYPLFGFPQGLVVQFGNDRNSFVYRATATHYNHPGFADAIILGLKEPVPESVAIPVPVLTDIPGDAPPVGFWANKTFEMVGWGGTGTTTRPRFRQKARAAFGAYPHVSFGFARPNQMRVLGAGGATVIPGDSGGPLFWTDPSGTRYLVGTSQGTEAGGGRYFVTWGPGGRDGRNNRRPDLGDWYEGVLEPGLYFDTRHGVPRNVRDAAVCVDGSVHQLRGEKEIWSVDGWAAGVRVWQHTMTLPTAASHITCAANRLFFIDAGGNFWQVEPGSDPISIGRLANSIALAGSEDSTLDFPFFWALNRDKKLWSNFVGGRDGQWQHAGTPRRTRDIAVAGARQFALNDDQTLWMNARNGRDGAWTPLRNAPPRTSRIAAARNGQSDDARLVALSSTTLHIGRVEPGGGIPDPVEPNGAITFNEPLYGGKRLDWCFVWGDQCGQPAANAWCKVMGFDSAKQVTLSADFARDIGASSPTYVLGSARTCSEATCDGFRQITCVKN